MEGSSSIREIQFFTFHKTQYEIPSSSSSMHTRTHTTFKVVVRMFVLWSLLTLFPVTVGHVTNEKERLLETQYTRHDGKVYQSPRGKQRDCTLSVWFQELSLDFYFWFLHCVCYHL